MTEQFGRVWRVTLEDLQTSDVDLTFKVTRSLYGQRAGTLELVVFNLTPDNRARAQSFQQTQFSPDVRVKRARVRLEAGYADPGLAVIFQGDVRRVWTLRDGTDWTTKVTAGDGEDALRSARGARAFAPDAQLTDVLQYAADAMGVGAGNLHDAIADRTLDRVGGTFPGGTVLHGPIARELSALLRSAGLEWSIQNGVLQVLPLGGQLNRAPLLLDPDHGLLEEPEVGINRVVSAKALLNPDIVPGAQVRLSSAIVKGYYRVESVEMSGDTRGNDWTAAMQLRRVLNDGTIQGTNGATGTSTRPA